MRYQQVFKKHIFPKATDLANYVLLGNQDPSPNQPTPGNKELTAGRSAISSEVPFSHLQAGIMALVCTDLAGLLGRQ